MSQAPTNTDIMRAVAALREEFQKFELSLDQHGRELAAHDSRITSLETLPARLDRLTEHVADIGAKVGIMLQRFDAQERLMSEALRVASRALVSEVTASVRAELGGVREDVGQIKTLLHERPCLVGETCTVHGGRG